jgi:Ca2+-binding EF-hand superfamily protein
MMRLALLLIPMVILTATASCSGQEDVALEAIDTPFYELDSNSDGLVSREEAESHSIAAYFDDINTNLNGSLEPEEYDEFVRTHPSLTDPAAEVDKSGSRNEAGMALGLNDTFDELDKDTDNQLSKAEVSGDLLENFARIDLDGDNYLNRIELQQYVSVHGMKL